MALCVEMEVHTTSTAVASRPLSVCQESGTGNTGTEGWRGQNSQQIPFANTFASWDLGGNAGTTREKVGHLLINTVRLNCHDNKEDKDKARDLNHLYRQLHASRGVRLLQSFFDQLIRTVGVAHFQLFGSFVWLWSVTSIPQLAVRWCGGGGFFLTFEDRRGGGEDILMNQFSPSLSFSFFLSFLFSYHAIIYMTINEFLSLSLSHTHTHARTHAHTHTHTHTHTHARTHAHTQSPTGPVK